MSIVRQSEFLADDTGLRGRVRRHLEQVVAGAVQPLSRTELRQAGITGSVGDPAPLLKKLRLPYLPDMWTDCRAQDAVTVAPNTLSPLDEIYTLTASHAVTLEQHRLDFELRGDAEWLRFTPADDPGGPSAEVQNGDVRLFVWHLPADVGAQITERSVAKAGRLRQRFDALRRTIVKLMLAEHPEVVRGAASQEDRRRALHP